MNYLFLLPDELINLILEKCAEDCLYENFFVKFEYIIYPNLTQNCILKKYHEYFGMMKNKIPINNKNIISGTTYYEKIPNFISRNMKKQNNILQNKKFETQWLCRPFLYVLKNYQLKFIS